MDPALNIGKYVSLLWEGQSFAESLQHLKSISEPDTRIAPGKAVSTQYMKPTI